MNAQKKKDYLAQLETGIEKSTELQIKELQMSVDLHVKGLDWLKTEIESKKSLIKVMLKNPKPTTLEYEYQKDPEFWKLNETLSLIKHQREMIEMESNLSGFDKAIELKTAEIKRLKGE